MVRWDYDPKNDNKEDWITLIFPSNKTEKGRYINDAFKWWSVYDFKNGWVEVVTGKPLMMEFKFDTATYYIPDRTFNILRFIKNLQKLPSEFFKGKTWYDSLTGMARFGYVPLMRKVA